MSDLGIDLPLLLGLIQDGLLNGASRHQHQHQYVALLADAVGTVLGLFAPAK